MSVINATFFPFFASFCSVASTFSSSSKAGICGANTSSINACAAGSNFNLPLSALFISRPGINIRLISFVPSKIRLMRESR